MDQFTYVVACLPFLAWMIFRIVMPRMLIKEILQENVHSNPKGRLLFMFCEGLYYGVSVIILKPHLIHQKTISDNVISLYLIFLSFWCIGHAVYIWKLAEKSGKLSAK